jgi:hypothetical protein
MQKKAAWVFGSYPCHQCKSVAAHFFCDILLSFATAIGKSRIKPYNARSLSLTKSTQKDYYDGRITYTNAGGAGGWRQLPDD